MATSRRISIRTPLPADKLLIRAASITEQLGQPLEFDVELLSPDESVNFDAVLGKDMTLSIATDGGGTRHFHGYIARFSQQGRLGDYVVYSAHVVPWLWFLTRAVNYRIFQERDLDAPCTVPNIVKKVFRDHGFTDIKDTLTATYRTREHCVQYAESDFNFVQRLMQEEGIYYYFKHDAKVH